MKARNILLLTSFTFGFMLLSWDASADASCYEHFQSLTTQTSPPLPNQDLIFPLYSSNSNGPFRTKAVMHLSNLGAKGYQAWLQFPASKGMISLPYNLFRIEIVDSRGSLLFNYDLTAECRNAGVSLFPGQEVRLPAFKIPLSKAKIFDVKQFLIKVWGRL